MYVDSSNQDSSESDNEEKKFFKSVLNKAEKHKSDDIQLAEMTEMLENEDKISGGINKHKNAVNFDEFEEIVKNSTYELFSRYFNIYVNYVSPQKIQRVKSTYDDRYSCCPLPIALIIISTIELTCFIIDKTYVDGKGPVIKSCIYHPYRRYEAWRFLTYMFVHVGYHHLIINLLVQLMLGVPLEMVHKGWRVLIVYFSGIIAGSLGTSIIDPGIYLAGASGGVYALITAHIGTIIMNWTEMDFPGIQLGVFSLIIGFDVGTSVYSRYFLEEQQNIGYVAHICGAIAGLLVGIWYLKNFKASRKENFVWWCALTIYIIFMGTMIVLNIVWTNRFLPSRR